MDEIPEGCGAMTAVISVFAFVIGLGMGSVMLIWTMTRGLPEPQIVIRYLPPTTTTTMVPTTPLTPGEQRRLDEVKSTDEITPAPETKAPSKKVTKKQ